MATTDGTPPSFISKARVAAIRELFGRLLSPALLLAAKISEFLLSLSRLRKQVIMMAADGVMMAVALFWALAVQSSGDAPIGVAR